MVDNKYRIESVLGEGGMGIVYLALDQNTNTHVVVKAIRGELAHNPDLRERVLAEGRALAQIDHPNVVRLNAIVIEHGIELYLVMQYIEGQSLDRLIEKRVQMRQPLPFPEALGIFRQVIAGVGAAHREGVVHRDIKPGNVLLRAKDGVAKVTDFGIAKMEADAKAGKGKTQGIIGSLWYMAPEQVTGRRDLDKRVDIYALGILFYEMLVGRVPFDANSDYDLMKMHVEAPMPSVAAVRPDVPAWVDALLTRACAKDREHRFATCDEMLATIEHFSPEYRGTGVLPAVIPGVPQATTIPQGPLSLARGPQPSQPALSSPPSQPSQPFPTATAPTIVPAQTHTSHPALTPHASHPALTPQGNPRSSTQDEAPSSSITTPRDELPEPSRWPWALGGLAVLGLAAGGVWLFAFSGLLDPEPKRRPRPATSASAPAPPASSAPPVAPGSRLEGLQGRWISESGRRYQAVKVANFIEFRILDPRQFEGQDYQPDESRFVLSEAPGNVWFGVKDKIRPRGPSGTTFDPGSRGTCQVVWESIQKDPLKAYFDGTRLRVDMVNLSPTLAHFEQRGGKVIGCNRLDSARADKIETTLTRE